MSQSEAWVITALGMTVVFIGLLLCVAFIQLFSRLAARISWGDGPHSAPAAASAPAPGSPAVPAEPIPADILAVIATAIEVERKLYVSRPDARRPALQS
jgi:Na+-transporting methylmalonyl-CoA/oxaloacetate decarboxylase gamma subunit